MKKGRKSLRTKRTPYSGRDAGLAQPSMAWQPHRTGVGQTGTLGNLTGTKAKEADLQPLDTDPVWTGRPRAREDSVQMTGQTHTAGYRPALSTRRRRGPLPTSGRRSLHAQRGGQLRRAMLSVLLREHLL